MARRISPWWMISIVTYKTRYASPSVTALTQTRTSDEEFNHEYSLLLRVNQLNTSLNTLSDRLGLDPGESLPYVALRVELFSIGESLEPLPGVPCLDVREDRFHGLE